MAIHNWIRCHWRNGRHVLHDVPVAWHDEIEAHIKKHRTKTRDLGIVRTATLESVELAWVECDVPLGSPAGDLTYRQARAVHALVRPRISATPWSRAEAEMLLTERYGEAVEKGLASQHRVLSQLSHPQDVDWAAGLFVGREAPLPSNVEVSFEGREAVGGLGYAQRHLIDAWEDWVANPRRRPVNSSEVAPSREEGATSASAPAASVAPALPAGPDSPWARMVVADEPSQHANPPTPSPPEPTPGATESEPRARLFDLTTPRGRSSDAPASSLSSLLRPSRT